VYNLEDALVVAQWLNVFLRKSDVLEAACLAQMVNVIAPILTTTDQMLLQSTYYPFQMMASRARGNALDAYVESPVYSTKSESDIPYVDVSASWDDATNTGACFIVNRHQTESMTVTIRCDDGMPAMKATSAVSVYGDNPKSFNTFDAPDAIVARPLQSFAHQEGAIVVTVPPLSSTAVDLKS
jgi:alpha-N-arabinofuranosidase